MKLLLVLATILIFLVACDRRDDPNISPDSQGVSSPPGESVGNANGSISPQHPPDSVLNQAPPTAVPAQCNGLTGGMLEQCIKQQKSDAEQPVPKSESKDGIRIP